MFEARFLIRGIGYLYAKCGTTEEIAAYVGPKGELAVNTDTHWLHVQDGETPGGIPLFTGGGGVEASFIRVSGSGKPIDTSLTGLEAAETTQSAVVGEAFRFNSTTKLIEVTRDCIATIIGIGTAPAPTDRPSEDANGNFRALLRRKKVGASGKGEILAEVRTFIRYARHSGSLSCPINAQLFTGDTLNIETCCYDAARDPGDLLLTVAEIPRG